MMRVIDFKAEDGKWKPSGKYIYREYNGFQRCLPMPSYVWEVNAHRRNPILERVADFSGPVVQFIPGDEEREYINRWDLMGRSWTRDNDPYQSRVNQLPASQLRRETTAVEGAVSSTTYSGAAGSRRSICRGS